jgi:cell division protein FtsL
MAAYQVKITIKGSKPPIWRRVLMPAGLTYAELHQIIQKVYSWSSSMPYEFEFRSEKVRVSEPQVSNEGKEKSLSKYREISAIENIDYLVSATKKFIYKYRNWILELQVEDTSVAFDESFAQVIKHKGDQISEEINGIEEYYQKLNEGSSPNEVYDISQVNQMLEYGENIIKESTGAISLKEIFESYDKESITNIAKCHGVKGLTKWNKTELAHHTADYITKKEHMNSFFLCLRDKEIELFDQLLLADSQIEVFDQGELDYLYEGGYITTGALQNYIVSAEVRDAYDKLNTKEFQEKRSRICKIGDYIRAANSLYAVTPVSILIGIFNHYESDKLTEEELIEACEILMSYREEITYIDGYLVDDELIEEESYKSLYNQQKEVPYYIPTPEEIKFMADHEGFLNSEELNKLRDFLMKDMRVDEETVEFLLLHIQAEISLGGVLQNVVDDLEAAGIIFHNTDQTEKFAEVIIDVWNHTRMVLNRGYTPNEMAVNGLGKAPAPRRIGQKVYPNDPCPCGSGKKYKKCCGKN